jgi:hypothetical protein
LSTGASKMIPKHYPIDLPRRRNETNQKKVYDESGYFGGRGLVVS